MSLPEKLFTDKKAMEAYLKWKKQDFMIRIIIWSFVFINILIIVLHLNIVEKHFLPEFLYIVRTVWVGVWGTTFISQVIKHIFKR